MPEYTKEQIDTAKNIVLRAIRTERPRDLTVDACKILLSALSTAEQEISKAFDYLAILGVPRERASTVNNGVMVFEERISKQATIDRAECDALAAYAAKLEKAGDKIRNYKPDSNQLQAETDIEELFDDWDAARKEKPGA